MKKTIRVERLRSREETLACDTLKKAYTDTKETMALELLGIVYTTTTTDHYKIMFATCIRGAAAAAAAAASWRCAVIIAKEKDATSIESRTFSFAFIPFSLPVLCAQTNTNIHPHTSLMV